MARPSAGTPSGRDALLDAAWALLVESHADGSAITVARVCRVAGCTPPTLYHHFADLPSLLRSASERAFADWAAQIEVTVGAHADPATRLRTRGTAYVEWGVAHPRAYRALFAPVTPAATPGAGPGHGFRELLADLAQLAGTGPDDPALLPRALAHWSAVHGLTTLAIDNPSLPPELRGAAYDQLSRALLADATRDGTTA